MAQTQSSDTGGWGASLQDFLFGVADKAIAYEQAKNVDVETTNSGNNIPDRNDMIHRQGEYAASDSLGGTWSRSFGGLTVPQWGLLGLAVAVFSVVISKVLK